MDGGHSFEFQLPVPPLMHPMHTLGIGFDDMYCLDLFSWVELYASHLQENTSDSNSKMNGISQRLLITFFNIDTELSQFTWISLNIPGHCMRMLPFERLAVAAHSKCLLHEGDVAKEYAVISTLIKEQKKSLNLTDVALEMYGRAMQDLVGGALMRTKQCMHFTSCIPVYTTEHSSTCTPYLITFKSVLLFLDRFQADFF